MQTRAKWLLLPLGVLFVAIVAWPVRSSSNNQQIAPMERRAWKPTQGGGRVAVANLAHDRSAGVYVPLYIDGQIELAIQRQVKLPDPLSEASLFRMSAYLGPPGAGCCGKKVEGDGKPIILQEVHGEPSLMAPGEWINDVVTCEVPCLPGRYLLAVAIEEYCPPTAERGERWSTAASKIYEIDVR